MKNLKNTISAIALAALLMVGTTLASTEIITQSASQLTPVLPGEWQQMKESELNGRIYEARIARIEKHLQRTPDGTLVLKPQTHGASLSEEDKMFAKSALYETNKAIKAGEVTVGEKFIVSPTIITRGNYSDVRRHWWGYEIWMNDRQIRHYQNRVQGGMAAAGVIAAVFPPAAEVAGPVAATLGMYAWWIDRQASYGRGIYIRALKLPGRRGIPVWLNDQG